MGAESTVYDIRLRYLLEDRATGRANEMARSFERAGSSALNLGGALRGVAAAAGAAFGFAAAKRSLIDFNSTMEQARLGMAGLFQMNLGGTFGEQMERADYLVGRLQQRMKYAVGTTQEAVQMASMLAQPFSAAGASMKQMEDMTVGVVVGARAMGIAADVAARDVDQAMRGLFRSVDPFTGKLLGARGYAGEAGRAKFNKLSAEERFKTINEALNQPALKDMANAQAKSFSGVLSTFQDNLQMTLGKVGQPLFQAITAEIAKWNEWIERNGAAIERFGRQASDYLMAGFSVVKDALTFMIENKEILLSIAAAWAGIKIAGGVKGLIGGRGADGKWTGGAGGLVQTAAEKFAAFGTGAMTVGGVMSTLAINAGAAAAALVVMTEASKAAKTRQSEPILQESKRFLLLQGAMEKVRAGKIAAERIDMEAAGANVRKMVEAAKGYGILDERGQPVAKGGAALAETISAASKEAGFFRVDERQAAFMEAMRRLVEDIRAGRIDSAQSLGLNKDVASMDPAGKKAQNKDIKVTINRIEVKSDDPDRFYMGLAESLNDTIRNGAAAFDSMRG